MIDTWYRPHHERLRALTQQCLDQYGRALLIDAHSFPSNPLPYELDQRTDCGEICIGTDEFHTPKALEVACVAAFRSGGFDVRVNAPFAGALVPLQHCQSDKRVSSVMVEANRALYWDETSGSRNPDFNQVTTRIRQCIDVAIQTWSAKVAE